MNAEISTDPKRLDIDWIVRELRGSYWGSHLTSDQILIAVRNSLCAGAYEDGRQVGLCRAVSDFSTFSSITDAIVQSEYRGKGIGSRLVEAVLAYPGIGRTFCILQTRPVAYFWYLKFGFQIVDSGIGIMIKPPNPASGLPLWLAQGGLNGPPSFQARP